MKDFITTGFHKPTLTTFEDPRLKVLEQDNGNTWTVSFYVGTELIDTINMEYLKLYVVHKGVLNLPVYESYNNKYVGTVGERISEELTSKLDMKFISQTSSDEKGNYTMTWKDKNGNTVITEHNLFN